ncbi:MAG: T9SS type A sorting domain-containing protein [Flavobacterium sp.]|nr:T9SS type A sorting domain-containing protein [Flavobacterium sp.]
MKKILYIFLIVSCSVLAQPKITASEYFWGTNDPGTGNGISLSVEDGVFDEVVESVITTFINSQTTVGPLLFNIRVKDVNNQWGPTFKKVIFILPSATGSFRHVNLTKFEYFFGNFDPGEGAGTTIIAFDGALDEAVETVFRSQVTWDVSSGPILFNIRAKDADNRWGPLFKKTVFPYGANPNANLVQEGDAIQICPGSSVTLNYAGPNGYTPTWFDGSHGQSITFTPTTTGDYSVSATLENTTYTDAINITFRPLPTATITPAGQVLVCASSNFNLVANSGTNLSYQWILNGNNIVGGTNANYLPTATGNYSVKVTDSSTGCVKTSDATVLASSFVMSPNGTNSFCGSQVLSVPFGSSNGYQWKKDGVILSGAVSNSYTATQSGAYTCVVTNGACVFTTASTTLSTTPAPTGASPQQFTLGNTLSNLTVNGASLLWYTSAVGGSAIPSSTVLVNGSTYYVSQTVNGCESPVRLSVVVQQALSTPEFNLFSIEYSPNPVHNILHIKSDVIVQTFRLISSLGQLINQKEVNNNEFEFDFTSLPTGVYFVGITTSQGYKLLKIIKE